MSRRKFNKEELKKLVEFYRLRRVVPIEGCKQCNHNAAFVVDKHPFGRLVQCTRCNYYQIIRNTK